MTVKVLAKADAAGLLSSSGLLGGEFPLGPWYRPKDVRLDDKAGAICYEATAFAPGIRTAPQPRMLDEFVLLAEEDCRSARSAKAVLAFAKRWGVLRLCQHGAPTPHPPYGYWPVAYRPRTKSTHDIPTFLRAKNDDCSSLLGDAGEYSEPVELWLMWARRASALVHLAATLRDAGKARVEDWWATIEPADNREEVELLSLRNHPGRRPRPNLMPWTSLAEIGSYWLRFNGLRLALEESTERVGELEFCWETDGPFGALAFQLACVLKGLHRLAPCKGCKGLFSPGKHEKKYCVKCQGDNVPAKLAARAYRAKGRIAG
jgi:hypothetical protein